MRNGAIFCKLGDDVCCNRLCERLSVFHGLGTVLACVVDVHKKHISIKQL